MALDVLIYSPIFIKPPWVFIIFIRAMATAAPKTATKHPRRLSQNKEVEFLRNEGFIASKQPPSRYLIKEVQFV